MSAWQRDATSLTQLPNVDGVIFLHNSVTIVLIIGDNLTVVGFVAAAVAADDVAADVAAVVVDVVDEVVEAACFSIASSSRFAYFYTHENYLKVLASSMEESKTQTYDVHRHRLRQEPHVKVVGTRQISNIVAVIRRVKRQVKVAAALDVDERIDELAQSQSARLRSVRTQCILTFVRKADFICLTSHLNFHSEKIRKKRPATQNYMIIQNNFFSYENFKTFRNKSFTKRDKKNWKRSSIITKRFQSERASDQTNCARYVVFSSHTIDLLLLSGVNEIDF